MSCAAENIATLVVVLAASALLIPAASPHWLPAQELPPPAVYADALGNGLGWLLDAAVRLTAWIRSTFDPSHLGTG